MKIVFTILFSLLTLCSSAQDKKKDEPKKEEYKLSTTLKTVRGYLKDNKNADANNEAEKAIHAHPEARQSAQLYALKAQALHALVLDENKKMYLKQKPDTSKYFNYIYSLYDAALNCDSLDQLPDAKGRVPLKFREANQQRLLQFRKNLSTADRYFYLKKDYKNAYKYADLYLRSKNAPVFSKAKGGNALSDEKDSLTHASLAVFLAYAYNNYNGVVKYIPIALQDTARLSQIYEVGAKSYYELGDTLSAHMLLFDGVNKYPTNDFFYMTLVKYYNSKNDYQSAIDLIDSVLVHMPDNRNCLYLKSREYENLGDYDNAIKSMNQVVDKYKDDFEAFSSLGNLYLEKAHLAYRNFNLKITDKNYQKGRNQINAFYSKSKDAYEKCRALAEKKQELWLKGLQECYYKLNLGKELKSLEKLK